MLVRLYHEGKQSISPHSMELRLSEIFTSYSHAKPRDLPRDYNGGVDFALRDFQNADFDTLWSMDQLCFAAGIAYSRQELSLYIRDPRSFTLVAESIPAEGK